MFEAGRRRGTGRAAQRHETVPAPHRALAAHQALPLPQIRLQPVSLGVGFDHADLSQPAVKGIGPLDPPGQRRGPAGQRGRAGIRRQGAPMGGGGLVERGRQILRQGGGQGRLHAFRNRHRVHHRRPVAVGTLGFQDTGKRLFLGLKARQGRVGRLHLRQRRVRLFGGFRAAGLGRFQIPRRVLQQALGLGGGRFEDFRKRGVADFLFQNLPLTGDGGAARREPLLRGRPTRRGCVATPSGGPRRRRRAWSVR